ncbi:MAG: hypothetical protein V2I33_12740 [Kangiellaceae bacterium]|jgi:hypothetical protein|nr:hypothetical protein [Kangiellaceae bacterium]
MSLIMGVLTRSVDDLGGTSISAGGTLGKKSLAKSLGKAGKALNALPGVSVTGQFISGENGIKGVQAGAGSAGGATLDVDLRGDPTVLTDKEF